MSLTPAKEDLMNRLNATAENEYQAACEKADRAGKARPQKPVALTPADLEFPRWVHKEWKLSGQNDGHYVPAESKLAKNAEQLAELSGLGFSDAGPSVKKEAPAKVK